jgi:hypothetical protein
VNELLCHKNLKIRLTASQVCNLVKPYLIWKSGFIFENFFTKICVWGAFFKFVQMLHAPSPLTMASVQRSSGFTRNTTYTQNFYHFVLLCTWKLKLLNQIYKGLWRSHCCKMFQANEISDMPYVCSKGWWIRYISLHRTIIQRGNLEHFLKSWGYTSYLLVSENKMLYNKLPLDDQIWSTVYI